jgi:hypothetical protein
MPIEIQGPDGSTVQFPDGTPPDVMTKAMRDKFGGPVAPQAEPSFARRLAQSAGINPPANLEAQTDVYQRGVVRGMRDPIDAGAQLLTRGLEALSPAGTSADSFMKGERQNVEQINKTVEHQYQQQRGQAGLSGFDPGRLIGNVAGTAPLATLAPAGIVGGAATGAATGALQPVYGQEGEDGSFWSQKGKQTAIGGVSGAAGAAIAKALSRIISPKSSPEVQRLMDMGVSPTPGQTLGGAAKRIEDAATSIPLVGDVVKRGQTRAMEEFNRGTINEALKPIGEKLGGKTMLGREAIDEAITKVSSAYDDLLPKMVAKADPQFVADMTQLRSLSGNMLPDRQKQFQQIAMDKLFSKFNPQTQTISGTELKVVESELGRLARNFGGSQDADQRLLGDAVKQLQANLRSLVERSNPQFADQLGKINSSYAQVIRLQRAAGYLGAEDGVFSPSQLLSAVKASDRSLNKRAFARGDALLQDTAEAGKSVLGPRVPDSGTPLRAMVGGGLLAGAAGGGGALAGINPIAAGGAGLGLLAGYTPVGQRLTANLLARRPEAATPLAQAIEQALPYIGSGAGAAGLGLLGTPR